jgi:hypothetical protein
MGECQNFRGRISLTSSALQINSLQNASKVSYNGVSAVRKQDLKRRVPPEAANASGARLASSANIWLSLLAVRCPVSETYSP